MMRTSSPSIWIQEKPEGVTQMDVEGTLSLKAKQPSQKLPKKETLSPGIVATIRYLKRTSDNRQGEVECFCLQGPNNVFLGKA